MALLGELARGVAVGLGVEHGKDATAAAGRRVAEQAGDAEHEASYIDGPIAAPLWGAYVARLTEAGVIQHDQAAIVATLLSQRDTELDRIVRELRNDSPIVRARVVYGAAGDPVQFIHLPDLPDNGQQWLLDTVTAWADPAAIAAVNVVIGGNTGQAAGGNTFAVPLGFVAPKTGPVSVPVKLPARTDDAIAVAFTGTLGDRAACVFVYKRG